MIGLTTTQLNEIYDFVQKNHRFSLYVRQENRAARKKEFPNLPDGYGFGIKYIETSYDSRDGLVWCISFRQGKYGVEFSTNHFVMKSEPPSDWKYDNLYDLCMDYLRGDFIPTKDFRIDTD